MDLEDINDLYNSTEFDYKFFWSNTTMHYGFDSYLNFRSLENSNRYYMGSADCEEDNDILVVGCGRGGLTNFLAEETDAEITGLDLNENHVEEARELVRSNGNDDVEIVQGDFHNLPFDEGSFDRVIAVETVSHSDSKDEFTEEAYRVLREDGKILVSDGWLTGETYNLENPDTENYSEREEKLIQDLLAGWALPEGKNHEEFAETLTETGFKDVDMENHLDMMKPSIRKVYLLGIIGVPLMKIGKKLGLRNEWSLKQAKTLRAQYHVFKEEIGVHADFTATK